jgi:hypothetical protein
MIVVIMNWRLKQLTQNRTDKLYFKHLIKYEYQIILSMHREDNVNFNQLNICSSMPFLNSLGDLTSV